MAYVAIPTAWVAVGAPITNQLMTRIKDNLEAVSWSAPDVQTLTSTGTVVITSPMTTLLVNNSAAITLTLPTAVGISGYRLSIKKIANNSHAATIDGNSSETIEGSATYALSLYLASVILISDGTNWRIDSERGSITMAQTFTAAQTFGAATNPAILGTTTNTPYASAYTTINSNLMAATPTGATGAYGSFVVGANTYVASWAMPTRLSGLGGAHAQFVPNTAGGDVFRLSVNAASDGATTNAVNVITIAETGAITLAKPTTFTGGFATQTISGAVTWSSAQTIGTSALSENHTLSINVATDYSSDVQFSVNGVAKGYIGATGIGGNLLASSASAGDLVVRSETGNIFLTYGATSLASFTSSAIALSQPVTIGDSGNTQVHDIRSPTQTTVGAAGGASALPATPTGFVEIKIKGTAYVIPYYAKS